MPNPKEVTPVITPNSIPKEVIQVPKPEPGQTKYKYIGKESPSEVIGKTIPKQLIPTKRMGSIFGVIILAVIILALIQFPYGSLMSGNMDITIDIGFPWIFLQFSLTGETAIKLTGIFLDLLLYLLLSYAIDISLNLILNNPLLKSEEDKKKKPAVFKDQKTTIADKITEKIFTKKQQINNSPAPTTPIQKKI